MNYLLSVNAFDKRNHKISVQYNAGHVIHVGGEGNLAMKCISCVSQFQ